MKTFHVAKNTFSRQLNE